VRKTFKDFGEFSDFVKTKMDFTKSGQKEMVREALTTTILFLQKKVKEKFGEYQRGWPELTDATKLDRVRKGYPENEPLLRDGTLRESVEVNVGDISASVGSNNPVMIYQEKGTVKTGWNGARGIPPRPVFLITHQDSGAEAVELFAKTLFEGMRRKL